MGKAQQDPALRKRGLQTWRHTQHSRAGDQHKIIFPNGRNPNDRKIIRIRGILGFNAFSRNLVTIFYRIKIFVQLFIDVLYTGDIPSHRWKLWHFSLFFVLAGERLTNKSSVDFTLYVDDSLRWYCTTPPIDHHRPVHANTNTRTNAPTHHQQHTTPRRDNQTVITKTKNRWLCCLQTTTAVTTTMYCFAVYE